MCLAITLLSFPVRIKAQSQTIPAVNTKKLWDIDTISNAAKKTGGSFTAGIDSNKVTGSRYVYVELSNFSFEVTNANYKASLFRGNPQFYISRDDTTSGLGVIGAEGQISFQSTKINDNSWRIPLGSDQDTGAHYDRKHNYNIYSLLVNKTNEDDRKLARLDVTSYKPDVFTRTDRVVDLTQPTYYTVSKDGKMTLATQQNSVATGAQGKIGLKFAVGFVGPIAEALNKASGGDRFVNVRFCSLTLTHYINKKPVNTYRDFNKLLVTDSVTGGIKPGFCNKYFSEQTSVGGGSLSLQMAQPWLVTLGDGNNEFVANVKYRILPSDKYESPDDTASSDIVVIPYNLSTDTLTRPKLGTNPSAISDAPVGNSTSSDNPNCPLPDVGWKYFVSFKNPVCFIIENIIAVSAGLASFAINQMLIPALSLN